MFESRPRGDYDELPVDEDERSDSRYGGDSDEKSPSLRVDSSLSSDERRRYRQIAYVLAFLLFAILNSTFAFAFGRYTARPERTDGTRVNGVGTEWIHFKYNQTFSMAPSNESNTAWGSIFPPDRGFFHDEKIAPKGASLSAFHQLHCLDIFRHSIYSMYDAVKQGETVDVKSLPERFPLHHAQHCIDFLRQKIMCNADLGVELVDAELNGIVGFGGDFQCTKWHEVQAWVVDKQTRWEGHQVLLKGKPNDH